ncbi:MAG: Ig-like domain-containing protein [archaeon]|nr:Ig-like domain-containing protein [archaeon]
MKDSTVVCILVAVALVGVAGIAVGAYNLLSNIDDDNEFEFTSTQITMLEGENHQLSIACLPGNAEYSDIEWESSNPAVATVVNGLVTTLSKGEATISASVESNVGSFTNECRIVVSDTKEDRLVSYNAFSDMYDYAVLTGSGFEKGMLSLTFNKAGNIVISLSGYDKDWLSLGGTKKFIGAAAVDFDRILMEVYKEDKLVANSVFEYGKETTDNSKYNSNGSAYTSLIAIKGVGYGTYDVKFTLEYGFNSKIVEGTFEYTEGNGYRDCTGTFERTYTWRCDREGLASGQKETRSITVTYDYEEYFKGYFENSTHLKKYSNGIVNESRERNAPKYVEHGKNVEALADALSKDYKKAYGKEPTNDQSFAGYLLSFLQICFEYEYDHVQYYDYAEKYSKGTDYWAYSSETLFSSAGDCEDTSILMCSIFDVFGYKTGLVTLPGHMTCAVQLDEFTAYDGLNTNFFKSTYDNKVYYFCETTSASPIVEYATPATGTVTKTYLTSKADIKSSTLLVKYSYSSALVGHFSKDYLGEEFTFYMV